VGALKLNFFSEYVLLINHITTLVQTIYE